MTRSSVIISTSPTKKSPFLDHSLTHSSAYFNNSVQSTSVGFCIGMRAKCSFCSYMFFFLSFFLSFLSNLYNVGLEFMTPKTKSQHSTDWASQAPLATCFSTVNCYYTKQMKDVSCPQGEYSLEIILSFICTLYTS